MKQNEAEKKPVSSDKSGDAGKKTVNSGEVEKKPVRGGRNLVILVLISTVVSIGLTAVSLAAYHYSGDIYLDRSRPGYLPDTEEVETEEENEEGDYKFEKNGVINKEVLDEYLEKLQVEVNALNDYQNPFSEAGLSDEQFGLQN